MVAMSIGVHLSQVHVNGSDVNWCLHFLNDLAHCSLAQYKGQGRAQSSTELHRVTLASCHCTSMVMPVSPVFARASAGVYWRLPLLSAYVKCMRLMHWRQGLSAHMRLHVLKRCCW